MKGGLLTVGLFSIALVCPPSPAWAEVDQTDIDFKSRTGAECAANKPASLSVARSGLAANSNATSTLEITCPIGHDLNSPFYLVLKIFLYKAPGTGAITCYLTYRDLGSGKTRTIQRATPATTGSPYVNLSFKENGGTGTRYTSDSANLTQSARDSANFTCVIPAVKSGVQSGILGYQYEEHP